MYYGFRWNDWNITHLAKHGVDPIEAEWIVGHPSAGYPKYAGDEKYNSRGQTPEGRYLQAAYLFDRPGVVYVIHARDLTDKEKRKIRRRRQ